MQDPTKFRNLAIIAHVDHGKTTLVDKLLQAGGAYRTNQAVKERAMDSMDLEREKGITIKAKNTSIKWKDFTINIVDTPGHADFGAEVERVMRMVDGVILVVDAFEGPQAQTRFVLKKALQEGLKPIVVVNKIDRPNAEPLVVKDKVLELFMELEASDEQFDAPFLFGSSKEGHFSGSLDEPKTDCISLLEKIVEYVPSPKITSLDDDFQMLVSNISWNDYVGRIAIGKITSGTIKKGSPIWLVQGDGKKIKGVATRIFEFSSFGLEDTPSSVAGNIVGIAGFEEVNIGETINGGEEMAALPFVAIDPPTITMEISINDGPLGGRDGKNVTSRVIRERLLKEMKTNISIKVEDTDKAGVFSIAARGAMEIAVLIETMRRENFEVCVSRPKVILKEGENGEILEPYETMYVEVPNENVQSVLKSFNIRKVQIEQFEQKEGSGRTFFSTLAPTRGIIGFETELVNMTSGHGIFSHIFRSYAPHAGEILTTQVGRLISMISDVTTRYALTITEERGTMFVGPGEDVYIGQIVGENPKPGELPLNPCRAKHLTNVRAAGKDKTITLTPAIRFSIEKAIEYIDSDELVEITPKFIRLRKRILDPNLRKQAQKAESTGKLRGEK